MSPNLTNTLVLAIAYGALFATAEWLHHRRGVPAEVTRKIVHVCTGLLALTFPLLLHDRWHVLGLCGAFLLILFLSMRMGLLRSINGVDRVTRGSLLYPIVVAGCYLLLERYDHYVFYYLPILVMALCDPLAAYVGMRWPRGRFPVLGGSKTLSGSLAFLAGAVIIATLLFVLVERAHWSEALRLALLIGAPAAVAEALIGRGYDNLFIPTTSAVVLVIARPFFPFLVQP